MGVASILGLVAGSAVAASTATAIKGLWSTWEHHEFGPLRRASSPVALRRRLCAGWMMLGALTVGSGACAYGAARQLSMYLTELQDTTAISE